MMIELQVQAVVPSHMFEVPLCRQSRPWQQPLEGEHA
jgi:hypothetical protein